MRSNSNSTNYQNRYDIQTPYPNYVDYINSRPTPFETPKLVALDDDSVERLANALSKKMNGQSVESKRRPFSEALAVDGASGLEAVPLVEDGNEREWYLVVKLNENLAKEVIFASDVDEALELMPCNYDVFDFSETLKIFYVWSNDGCPNEEESN